AHTITFCGIDSVGMACDGKLSDDDTAIRFHRALGLLPPSLCAAHVPKASTGKDPKTDPTPFGRGFFNNLARMSWIAKQQSSPDKTVVTIGLFPDKQNDGERRKAVGIEFSFDTESIGVRAVNLADVEGLAEKLPLHVRMRHALQHGPMTCAQLAE